MRAGSPRHASWWSRTRGPSPTPSGTTSNVRASPCRWPPTGRPPSTRFREEQPSLVILDLMLPELSGLDVCRAIRAASSVPIIIVTAKDSEADKVTGLEIGADDYVTKPFSIRELISRVRAHLRRAGMRSEADAPEDELLRGGPVEMDVAQARGHDRRRAGGLPTEGIRAAGGVPASQGPAAHQALPDRGGVGRRLRRRHQDARRPREASPPEDRGRIRTSPSTWSPFAGSATSSSTDQRVHPAFTGWTPSPAPCTFAPPWAREGRGSGAVPGHPP